MPIVSVIIPTYNRAGIIGKCLNSVKNQTFKNFECLIVDDFSEDNTREVIEEYSYKDPRFKYLQNNRKKGAPGSRNTGLYAAKGEYIIFLDSDDLILPHCIESRLHYFLSDPEIDLVIGLQKILDNGKESFYVNIPSMIHPLIRFYSLGPSVDIPWINNSCLIKKSFVVDNQIAWDESVELYQDVQFNLHLLLHNPEIKWSDSPFDSYWVHDKNTNSIGKQRDNKIIKLKKIIEIFSINKQHIFSNNLKLYKFANKQYHAYLLNLVFSISVAKNDDFKAFLSFVESKSDFNKVQINMMKIRNLLDETKVRKWHHRLFSKAITFYLVQLYKPVINNGSFCKHLQLTSP